MSKGIMDVIEGILEEGINDQVNKITADNVKDGKNFGGDFRSAETKDVEGSNTEENAGDTGEAGKGEFASDASADTQGVLGTETGSALDGGGDTDVGGPKGDNASDASADTSDVEGKKTVKEEEEVEASAETVEEAADKGDMDGDGVDEPDDKEYMDNKDAAIKKAMKEETVEEAKDEEESEEDESEEDETVEEAADCAKVEKDLEAHKKDPKAHQKEEAEAVEEETEEVAEETVEEEAVEEAVEGEELKKVEGEANKEQRPDEEKGDNAPETKEGSPDQGPHDQSTDEAVEVSEEEAISEEYKAKAEVIFEAAVGEKVNMLREEMEAEFASKLEEETARLNEEVAKQVSEAVAEWLQENALEVRYSLRTEIAENFIKGLKGLFEESYIEIPEEQASVVDELTEAVEEQRDMIADLEAELSEARAFMLESRKSEIVASLSEDLTQTQALRLAKLAEGLEAESVEEFEEKVATLKEGYFDEATGAVSGYFSEEVLEPSESYLEESVDSTVSMYAQYLGKTSMK